MPIKRKFTKKPIKRVKKTFVKKTQKKVLIPRNMISMGKGFPKKLQMTHTYNQSGTLSSVAGSFPKYFFSATGMYDPDYTGGGHQPMYFDQMALLYNHYVVIGSKITVSYVPSSTLTVATAVGLLTNDDINLTSTDYSMFKETTGSRTRMLCPGINNVTTLTANYSAKKVFGGSVLSNNKLSAVTTANPSENQYFTLVIQPMDLASTVSMLFNVTITYIAVWTELKEITGS